MSLLQNVALNPPSQERTNQQTLPTPVSFPKLKEALLGHPENKFATQLINYFTPGVHIGFKGVRIPRFSKNLPTASAKPEVFSANWQTKFRLTAWLVLSIIHPLGIFKVLRWFGFHN